MNQPKTFLRSVLQTDLTQDVLLAAGEVSAASQSGEDITFSVSLARKRPIGGLLYFDKDEAAQEKLYCRLRFYGGEIVRLRISSTPGDFSDESPMLAFDPGLQIQPASLEQDEKHWTAAGKGSAFFASAVGGFSASLSPDGQAAITFQSSDQFVSNLLDSLPVFWLQRGDGTARLGFALYIQPGEHFCGTGERFERPDLSGQQIELYNWDAAGVNNARAYKNIPFLLSSRGYGVFVHSSAPMTLDVGAHSTRALQWLVEDDTLDIFFIGGGSLERVLYHYRRITGFPVMPPLWSFGVWMSRASYHSDPEVSEVARRMRAEGYPSDVLHLDIGWFAKEWFCDWKFSPQNFPDPQGFIHRMAEAGFRVTLWQYPYIRPEIDLAGPALEGGFVGKETQASHRHWLGYTLDLTNPEAVRWYQSLLTPLLEMGAAAIKADFGEEVDGGAIYAGMDGRKYHNLFALLYQKAVWEATERVHGEGSTLIWARAAWAGSQRYPVHWGGDAASTWDGLAGTLRGGLHFGLSGFAFWSHDVAGIHGIPDFERSRPAEDLYVRWTQFGVFSSHIRFHGGNPREPWEFPTVAETARQWLRFRYSLLPYILEQSRQCCQNGLPLLRSLVIDWPEDPAAWSLDDEYLFGDSFLVCPVISPTGVRNVYLPQGEWIDFWSGSHLSGPLLLRDVWSPLARLPLYVRKGCEITFAEPVQHTGQYHQAKRAAIRFDVGYAGFEASPLSQWLHFD